MKKFLVIDDSRKRQDKYNKVFNFLNLDYAFSKKEFVEKKNNTYDGYLIDVIYMEQQYEDYSFQQILENLPNGKPLFIISEHWSDAMDGMKMRYLVNSEKYNHVLGYLSWETIEKGDKSEIVKDYVRQQINNYYKLAFNAFDDDQDITILQISDVEFGNPEQEVNVETTREYLKRKVRENLRKLDISSEKVDFICICGDIAYLGEKSEYSKARKWLMTLGEEILTNKNFENILIVPGNHDYSFNAAAGNFYKYDKDKKLFLKRQNNDEMRYHEQGMYNFAKFVYELNGDQSYLLYPYRPIIKRTYENYGLNFILLNPIRIGLDKEFKLELEDKDMQYLLKYAEDISEEEICNIVISHFAPDRYSMKDPKSDSTNKDIRNIADALKIKGWFYGHAHDEESIDDRKVGQYKTLLSRTKTLMLNNVEHNEGTDNGFTIFKLYRKNNKVVNISYYDNGKKEEIFYENLFKK